jgi:hypothetical protein
VRTPAKHELSLVMRLGQRFEAARRLSHWDVPNRLGTLPHPGSSRQGAYTPWHILADFQERIYYDFISAQSLVVLHDVPTEVLSLSTSHKLSECPFSLRALVSNLSPRATGRSVMRLCDDKTWPTQTTYGGGQQ